MNAIRQFGLWLAGEQKSRNTAQTLPTWLLGRPYRPRTPVITTEEAVRRGYTRASIVYACIRLIADTATSVPLRVYRRDTDDYQAQPNHPLQALLDAPNGKLTRRRLYLRAMQHLQLSGNAVWLKVRIPKSGPPTQLWPISPDTIKPVPDERDYIAYYELTISDGRKLRIETRDVVHMQLENPETPWWGIGPLQAAIRDADLYLGNKAWNLRTVERGAVTPGVLEVPEDLTDDQWARLREQLDARTFGEDDAGKELILGSGMKYHRMSLTGEEMGFLESMRFGREEIAMVFGVPSAMLTPENATLANVEAYAKQFWEHTIVPLNLAIADILTLSLVPDYDTTGTLEVAHDYSQVPAMQTSINEQSEAAERLVRTGFTPAGVNRLLDLGFEDDEIKPATPPPLALPAPEDNPDESREERRHTGPTRRKNALDDLWLSIDAERTAWEIEIATRLNAVLTRERDAVLTRWTDSPNATSVNTAVDLNAPHWAALLTAAYVEAGRHFAAREYTRLAPKARKALDPTVISAEWAARHAASKVVGITATTKAMLRAIIDADLTLDEHGYRRTIDEIARDLADTYDSWKFTPGSTDLPGSLESRAYTIARTELGTAANTGHQRGAQQVADDYDLILDKVWASSLDDRVRDSHAAIHGETVPMDALFSNGLEYPGDPNGSAEEVVNCRCTVVHQVRH